MSIKKQIEAILNNPDNWVMTNIHGLPSVPVLKCDCAFKRHVEIALTQILEMIE